MEMKRNLLAIALIAVVLILMPSYLKLVSPDPQAISHQEESTAIDDPVRTTKKVTDNFAQNNEQALPLDTSFTKIFSETLIDIETDLFFIKLSNRGGGSLSKVLLKKYIGGYNDFGQFNQDSLVSLVFLGSDGCTPCLALFDRDEQNYEFLNHDYEAFDPEFDKIILSGEDKKTFHFSSTLFDGRTINKSLTFYGNSYAIDQSFTLTGFDQIYRKDIELVWKGGIKPTEDREKDENQYSTAVIYQAGEKDEVSLKLDNPVLRNVYDGKTNWVAIKNKYFIVSMISKTPGNYGTLSAGNITFGDRQLTPVYSASIGFDIHSPTLNSSLYMGPQDYRLLKAEGESLDDAMNWGYAFIRPISKYIILNLLTFLHNPFDDVYINYGLVLILFAFLIRLITGPLTKKSAESAQKMQSLQPKMKVVQEKYKDDPQRKNVEMMKITKEHGINPLGGCLPMLIQMPLLFALFVVFRNTIEFRGAHFIFWIKDLSQPDVIFNLPFSIPIYGNGVAILPIIMGVTMFLQQRQSMATMEKSQRPMMYIMSGFFFLLFNTFPSGLNLYYAVYNFLSFLQQKKIRERSTSKS